MGLLKHIVRKEWVCQDCDRIMEVIEDVTPWSHYDGDEWEGTENEYQILKCRGCNRYAVVGYKPEYCLQCNRRHSGVYLCVQVTYGPNIHLPHPIIYNWHTYGTYCLKCHRVIYSRTLYDHYSEVILKDEKGYYYKHGSVRYDIKLLPTLTSAKLKREWVFFD